MPVMYFLERALPKGVRQEKLKKLQMLHGSKGMKMKRLLQSMAAIVMFAAMALGTPSAAPAQENRADVIRLQSLVNQGWRIQVGPSSSHTTVLQCLEMRRRGINAQIVGVRTWD